MALKRDSLLSKQLCLLGNGSGIRDAVLQNRVKLNA
jgi:hypothetical protein